MDERFIEAAMKNYGDTVLRAAASVTGNKPDAEDVFSDVFFALFKYRGEFNSEDHLKAWLIRVTLNKAKNVRGSYRATHSAQLFDNIAAPEPPESAYDVPAAMQGLDPESRAAVYLHYYEGYRYAEVGAVLGMSEAGARTKVARARGLLRELLV